MITNQDPFQAGEIESKDYQPTYLYGPYYWEQRKPWFHRRFIPAMMRDSRVRFGLRLIKGPLISSGTISVKFDGDDEQKEQEMKAAARGEDGPAKDEGTEQARTFIQTNVDKFWKRSAIVALRALEWGYSGSEAVYDYGEDGLVHFDHLKSLASYDVRVWTHHGKKAAVRLRDSRDGKEGYLWLFGPKGFWHVHEREEHRWYGISRLLNAYPAWYDKHKNGGIRDSLSLFFYKYALTGNIVRYPPNMRKMPDGSLMDPKVEAEKIANNTRTGATIVLPNERDAEGNPNWEVEFAQNTASGEELMDYHRMLDKQIFEGLGIPEELIEAGTTSSGYAGRRVPANSFYTMLQELGEMLLGDFDEQIMRPLVEWNFGHGIKYELVMDALGTGGDGNPEEQAGEMETLKQEAITAKAGDMSQPQTNDSQ